MAGSLTNHVLENYIIGYKLDDTRGPICTVPMSLSAIEKMYSRLNYHMRQGNHEPLAGLNHTYRQRLMRLYLNFKRASAVLMQMPHNVVGTDTPLGPPAEGNWTLSALALNDIPGSNWYQPIGDFSDEVIYQVHIYPLANEHIEHTTFAGTYVLDY